MGRLRFAHIRRLRGLVPALLVPLMLAALVVSTLPVVIMYLLFYNQIMKGMMAGAVKG